MIACSLLHVLWCYIFITLCGLEVTGAGIALSITYFLNLFLLMLYVTLSKCTGEAWICINGEAFQGLGEFMRYGIPSALELFFEWAAFELISLLIGFIGVNELAASVITFNIVAVFYMPNLALGFVTTTLVGNSLGNNCKYNAIVYSRMSVVSSAFLTGIAVILTVVLRHQLAAAYSSNEDI